MAKMIFRPEKPHVNIGTIGHLGHGKTTLTSAIISYLAGKGLPVHQEYARADSAQEGTAHGTTVSVRHIEYETESRHYAHVDCPGSVDYVKNMFVGVSQMDGAILIVSAESGAMSQTREHLLLAKQAGISKFVVFLNKMDIADWENIDLYEVEIYELLQQFYWDGDNTPIIRGSALGAVNGEEEWIKAIAELMEAIEEYIPTPERAINKPFLMPVERIYTFPGKGAVVAGKIEQGRITKGDEIEIIGLNGEKIKSRVTDIEAFRKTLKEGLAGEIVGILLRRVPMEILRRGIVICEPNSAIAYRQFTCEVYLLKRYGRGMYAYFSGYSPQFHFRTATVTGRITLPQHLELVMSGDTVRLDVTLEKTIVLEPGLSFVIRDSGRTLGTGKIIQLPN